MVVLCLMAFAFQIFGIANLSHTSSLQFLWDESYVFQKSKFHDQQACKENFMTNKLANYGIFFFEW